MKYEINYKKLEEGMHEFMKDSMNELEKSVSKDVKKFFEFEEEMIGAKKKKNSKEFYGNIEKIIRDRKKLVKMEIKQFGNDFYYNREKIAEKYIGTLEYKNKFDEIIKEYINKIK